MNIPVAIFAGLVGWGGLPMPRPPVPKDPLAGIVGGILGAFLVSWLLDLQAVSAAVDLIAVSIGAFVGGRVLLQVVSWVLPDRSRG